MLEITVKSRQSERQRCHKFVGVVHDVDHFPSKYSLKGGTKWTSKETSYVIVPYFPPPLIFFTEPRAHRTTSFYDQQLLLARYSSSIAVIPLIAFCTRDLRF
jgi:hypothetical protein